jgi:hypothetical protein
MLVNTPRTRLAHSGKERSGASLVKLEAPAQDAGNLDLIHCDKSSVCVGIGAQTAVRRHFIRDVGFCLDGEEMYAVYSSGAFARSRRSIETSPPSEFRVIQDLIPQEVLDALRVAQQLKKAVTVFHGGTSGPHMRHSDIWKARELMSLAQCSFRFCDPYSDCLAADRTLDPSVGYFGVEPQ